MILCTATQPALDYVDHSLDIDKNAEIVSNIDSVIDAFKRVNIVDLASDKTFSNHHLASFIQEKLMR